MAVGVLVDLDLEHVVVELHRDPVVAEAVAVLALASPDARGLALADGADAPRTIAHALPRVGRHVERAAGDRQRAFPDADLRVAR